MQWNVGTLMGSNPGEAFGPALLSSSSRGWDITHSDFFGIAGNFWSVHDPWGKIQRN